MANACAVFFCLENLRDMRGLPGLTARLATLLEGEEHSALRRALLAWLEHVLLASLRHKMAIDLGWPLQGVNSLTEASAMLANRVDVWLENAAREGLRQGRLEGKLEGRLEGQREASRRILQRLLTHRFGPELPAWVLQALHDSDDAPLASWAEAVLDADSLPAVFGKAGG